MITSPSELNSKNYHNIGAVLIFTNDINKAVEWKEYTREDILYFYVSSDRELLGNLDKQGKNCIYLGDYTHITAFLSKFEKTYYPAQGLANYTPSQLALEYDERSFTP